MICTGKNKKCNNCSIEELAAANLNFRTRYFSLIQQVYINNCRQGKLINPIAYGGGGGRLFGRDHEIIDHNSKTALFFSFYLLTTFWQNFSKIDSP